MKSKYINPFTDYGFKKLFGEEGSKKLLINFLNDILPIKDKIKELSFQKNEQQGDSYVSRKAIYDLFCEDEKGNQFIVEMQNAKQTYFKDRAVFYTTFPIRDQAQKGDWDFKLKAVYCVGLLGFEFEKDEVTHVYEDREITIDEEEIFEEAFKIAETANYNSEEIKEYEDSLKSYRDNINVITTAKEEGREEERKQLILKQYSKGLSIEYIAEINEFNVQYVKDIVIT